MADFQGEYNGDSILTLPPLQHIRHRPGMYIGRLGDGTNQEDGIYVLIKEVIDNGIDEFTMGCGRRIDINMSGDLVSVRDFGRGIPLDKLVVCVSEMNTGGKYEGNAFSYSIGLNGVGLKAVNALSSRFRVRSVRDGRFAEAVFERAELKSEDSGDTGEKNGTLVEFSPDPEIFPGYSFKSEYLEKRLWMYAYLNCNLSLYLNGQLYLSRRGLCDLLESEIGNEKLYDVITLRTHDLEFALTHSGNYGETTFSFVNGQYTHDGGTHLSAFKEGVLKGINEFSGKSFRADDVRDGMVGAISIRIKDPLFDSQTKSKLGNTDVRGPIVAAVRDAIVDFLHRNKELAEAVIEKVSRNADMHRQIQEVRKKGAATAAKTKLRIPKLKDCKYHPGEKWPRGTTPRPTMIFLTEGDSAAGSLESCRDVEAQAIFALRGKPKNLYGEKFDKIYTNEEMTFLMQALGIEESVDNLRYDQVIIATDADVDGLHIRNLLITFFITFFNELVLSGHLYVLETPLFRVQGGSRQERVTAYCYNDAERDAAVARLGAKAEITRFKGLGEISPKEFKAFIGPEMRIRQVPLDNTRGIDELLGFFMGANTPDRKEYIMANLEVHDHE